VGFLLAKISHNHSLGSRRGQCKIPPYLIEEQMHLNQLKQRTKLEYNYSLTNPKNNRIIVQLIQKNDRIVTICSKKKNVLQILKCKKKKKVKYIPKK